MWEWDFDGIVRSIIEKKGDLLRNLIRNRMDVAL